MCLPSLPLVLGRRSSFASLLKPLSWKARWLRLAGIALFLALCCTQAQAQYTVVDSGSSATFTAPVADATAYAWTLDGSSVGTNSHTFSYAPVNPDVGTHDLIVYQTLATGGTTTAEWGVRVRIPIPTSPITYYVSTMGSDANNGSIGAPFRTLEAAQTAIRALSKPLPAGGVTVFLRSGTHWRTSTLSLTGSDSGTPSAPIIYSGYPGESVVLSTGTALASSAWAQLALSETNRVTTGVDVTRIWETNASAFTNKGPYPVKYGTWPVRNAQAVTTSVPDVFYKGARVWLSRYPNHDPSFDYLTPNLKMNGIVPDITGTGSLNTSGTYLTSSGSAVSVGGAFHYYSADAAHVTRWMTALSHGGLWLQGFWRVTWQSDLAKVLDIDTANQVIEFAPNAAPSGGFGNKYTRPAGNHAEPYWVINLLEEIDQPGEWCVDFSRNKLYFMMDGAGAPPDGSVVVADYTGPVVQISGSNIILRSLTFDESLGMGVLLSNTASRNLVTGCTFRNVTNTAVSIQSGSMNGVVSCNMDGLGSMATQITASGTAGSATPNQANFIVNNTINRIGRYAQMYVAGVNVVSPAAGNRVAHNTMYDLPHMGVQFAGYRNFYEFNDIGLYGTKVDDNGAYYSYEDYYGDDTFRFNYSHDTPLASAITYDGVNRVVSGHFFGNISQQDAACEGQSIGIGLCSGLEAVNNLSIGGGRYGSFIFTSGSQLNINNNVAVAGYYPPDFHWSLLSVVGGSNVFTTTTADVLGNGPNLSYTDDPGFIDMTGEDLRLRPDAQVLSDLPDFKPIPFELIGIYNDEYRNDATVYPPFVTSYGGVFSTETQALLTGTLVYPRFDANSAVSVYYGPVDGGTNAVAWAHVASLGVLASGSFSTLVSASTNQPVFYRLWASNPAGATWSEATSAAYPAIPSLPVDVTVTPGYAQNTLAWTSGTWAASYTVQRSTSMDGPYVAIAVGISGTNYVDTGLVTGVTYYYTVTADNASGSSSATSPSSGVPVPGMAVKANNSSSLDQGLSWLLNIPPTLLDTALFDSTYAYGAVGIGAGLTAWQLQLTNPLQAVTLSAGSGNLTLGGGGMDLSSATQNLTIASPVTIAAPQTWTVAGGRTLTVNGAIGDAGYGYGLSLSNSGTFVFAGASTFSGGLTIAPPAGGLPSYKFGGANPSPYVKLSGTMGSVTANGRLDLLNGCVVGTISGSGSAGFITYSDTTNDVLTFQAGSSFSLFKFGADYTSARLRSTGTAPVFFSFFGYNTSSPNASYTLDGGTWSFNQIGQNNTGAQTSGTVTVTGSAYASVLTQCAYSHGTWNVANGTLRFLSSVSESNGNGTGTNTALGFNVSNSGGGPGNLLVNGALTLADGGGASEANSATVSTGGLIYVQSGNLTLGSNTAHTAETDTFNLLPGGKLLVNGAITTLTGTASASGTTIRTFNWTGGQLTAATITTGSGFATPAGGGISAIALNQTNGTLAPGDSGTAGKITINGNYQLGAAGTLAIELGGTTQATAFQTGQNDYVYVTGSTTLSGSLAVTLLNNFTPTSSQTFTILTSTAGLSGTLTNVVAGNLISADGAASFRVTLTGSTVILSEYQRAILPPVITVPPTSGTANQGQPFTFSVTATGTSSSPITYQWQLNGAPITSATSAAYAIAAAQSTDAGNYNVIVANAGGSVTSSTATLTVIVPPLPPASVAAVAGNGVVTLTWASSAGAASYNVKRSTVSGGPYSIVVPGVTGTSLLDSSVSNDTLYYYVVSAINAAGEGLNSSETSARPSGPLPNGWSAGDLGAPGLAGTASAVSGTFTLKGAGADIWGTSDQFQFACMPWTGNGALVARVTDLTNTNAWAKAAVMFRETLSGSSVQVSAMLSYSSGCAFQYRSLSGGASTNFAQTTGIAAPRWIKLVRSGTAYRAYQAPDSSGKPGAWASIGSSAAAVSMTSGTIYAGLAVTSHNIAALCTAHFDHVGFYPSPVLSLPGPLSAEATGSNGAAVSFSLSGSSAIDGSLAVSASPAPRSVFALGATPVVVSATDSAGQVVSGTFTVTVRDTTPPTVFGPVDTMLNATTATGAYATFTAYATDLVSGPVPVVATPPSGSFFPTGTNTVLVTATDAAANTGSRSFLITVVVPPVTADEQHAPIATLTSGSFQFRMHPTVPGRTYQLQRSDSLQPNSWIDLSPMQTGNGGDVILQDAVDGSVKRRFYRVRLGP